MRSPHTRKMSRHVLITCMLLLADIAFRFTIISAGIACTWICLLSGLKSMHQLSAHCLNLSLTGYKYQDSSGWQLFVNSRHLDIGKVIVRTSLVFLATQSLTIQCPFLINWGLFLVMVARWNSMLTIHNTFKLLLDLTNTKLAHIWYEK